MPIAFACSCGKNYSVPEPMAGKQSRCRQCGAVLTVPSASAAAPADDLAALTTAPAGSPGKYKKRASRGKLVAGVLFFTLVLAAAGGGVAYWYLHVASPLDAAMRYVPDNPRLLIAMRVDALMASDAWRDLEGEIPERLTQLEKDVGIAPADIAHVLVAGTMHDRDQPVTIIQTKKNIAASDLLGLEEYKGFKEVAVGKYTMYEGDASGLGRPNPAMCVAESRVVIFGTADVLRPVLERGKAPTLSLETKTLIDETDFKQPMVFMLNTRNLRMTWMAGTFTLATQQFPGLVGFTVQVTAGKPNTLAVNITSDTPGQAEQTRKKIEAMIAGFKEEPLGSKDLMTILEGIKWRTETNRVLGTGQPSSVNVFKVLFGPGRRSSASKPPEGPTP